MTLNAPSQTLFIIAVILAVIALIGGFATTIAFIGAYSFWIMTLAFVVLAVGCLMRRA